MENIEIDLESSDATWFSDEENISVEKINFELVQSSKIRGFYRKISVFNDHQCYQTVKNKRGQKFKYRIDLSFLDPRPLRARKIAWKFLYTAIILGTVSLIMGYLNWFSGLFSPSLYFDLATVAVISAMLISLMFFANNSYDKIIFKSQYGRVNFLEMVNKYPSKRKFRKFLACFVNQVKSQKTKRNFSQSKYLTRELQELRRLNEENIIGKRQYESGKAIIFKHSSFKSA